MDERPFTASAGRGSGDPEPSASPFNWSARQALMAVLTVVAVSLVFLGLYRFYSVVFLLFVAIALQVALDPVVRRLAGTGINRMAAVLLIYAGMAAALVGVIVASAPVLVTQSRDVLGTLPASYGQLRLELLHAPASLVRSVGAALPQQLSLAMFAGVSADPALATEPATWLWVGWLGQALFGLFGVFALALYWTLEGELILRKLVLQAPPDRRDALRAFIAESQVKIGAYFRGQGILCAMVGIAGTLLLLALGIPNALFLGLAIALFEAVPVIGPLLGAVPAIIVTAAAMPDQLPWVILGLLVIQVVEANVLVPRVMNESVGVSAVVSILALAAFGALFGVVGAFLAIPLAAILQILLGRLLFQVPIGDEGPFVALSPENISRSHLGVLRLEAKGLEQAIRRQARSEDSSEPPAAGAEQIEDEIEAIAAAVDTLLARAEGTA